MDDKTDKTNKYRILFIQAEALIEEESNRLANMSNLCSLIHTSFGFWWTGYYFVEGNELVLGPFQGPVACTRISYGKGVCGRAWENKTSLAVPNVHEFEGHIACSGESNSEVVIPIWENNEVIGVFDVDSIHYDAFDQVDIDNLTKLVGLIWK